MARNSESRDSASLHSQMSGTVVGSPQEICFPKPNPNVDSTQSSPSEASFPQSEIDTPGSTHSSPTPPSCPSSNHPDEPLACPTTPSVPVPGWPQVSVLMSETPEFASFNRFSDLQIRSLLYYQAELENLKKELIYEEWEDYRCGDKIASNYCKRANYLVSSEAKQWKIMKQIRELLKEYNEALLQFSQISALPKPENHNMNSFNKWLTIPEGGNLCIGGGGEEKTWGKYYSDPPAAESLTRQFWKMVWSFIWSKPEPPCELDLASSAPHRQVDGFARWAANSFVPWWANWMEKRRKKKKLDEEKNAETGKLKKEKTRDELAKETLTKYSEDSILRFTSSITTVVACLLPTIAITVLSQVHGLRNLLLCLAGFAVVFAAGLIFLGTASRVEIFGATAAFSAVLVVFISVPTVVVPPSGVPYAVNS